MDSDFSLAYQAMKINISAMPKMMVVVIKETPKLSVRLSVISVPTTLSNTAYAYAIVLNILLLLYNQIILSLTTKFSSGLTLTLFSLMQ